jgi:hypothetical protein
MIIVLYDYIPNKDILEECHKEENLGSNLGCYCFLFKKNIAKRSAQRHIFPKAPPGRRPNDKYPVNTSHRSDLCKNISLHCYLVTTVIHIQSLCSQMCVYIYIYIYTYVLQNIETLVGQNK